MGYRIFSSNMAYQTYLLLDLDPESCVSFTKDLQLQIKSQTATALVKTRTEQ